MNEYDAKALINRQSSGILQSGLSFQQAQELQNALFSRGHHIAILPDDNLNKLDIVNVRKASLNDTLTFDDLYGKVISYDYSAITAVAIHIDKKSEKMTPKEREFILDIIFSDGTVLRINSKRFNYEYLGERKSHSVIQNFFYLLSDLEEKLGENVYRDPGYNYALVQQIEEIAIPETPKKWDLYIHWLTHLPVLKKEGLQLEKPAPVEVHAQRQVIPEISFEPEPEPPPEEKVEIVEEEIEPEPEPEPIPFENISSPELQKKVRAVKKAVKNGKSFQEVHESMLSKGVNADDAGNLISILEELSMVECEDNAPRYQILSRHKIPEELHNCFVKEKVNQGELLEKVRTKQGISKAARRSGNIKVGRIAIVVAACIYLLTGVVAWLGVKNENERDLKYIEYRYGHSAKNRVLSSSQYQDQMDMLKKVVIFNIAAGILFFVTLAASFTDPLLGCKLAMALFVVLVVVEFIVLGFAILNMGLIFKAFIFISLMHAIQAAKKNKLEKLEQTA